MGQVTKRISYLFLSFKQAYFSCYKAINGFVKDLEGVKWYRWARHLGSRWFCRNERFNTNEHYFCNGFPMARQVKINCNTFKVKVSSKQYHNTCTFLFCNHYATLEVWPNSDPLVVQSRSLILSFTLISNVLLFNSQFVLYHMWKISGSTTNIAPECARAI